MKKRPEQPMGIGLHLPRPKELRMRLYTQIFRLAIFASLLLTAAACAGWKWEGLAH
jgi:hypothetical protein